MEKLIDSYHFVLVEDHHHPGNGRYEVIVIPDNDISTVLPYLNSVLDDTNYDHDNKVLIGNRDQQRHAFRPREIRAGSVTDIIDASQVAQNIVDFINRTWEEKESIQPSTKERKLPTAYDIYKVLPRKNCRQCGCPTCLVFAAKLHTGEVRFEQCTLLSEPEYAETRRKVMDLFPSQQK